MSKRIVRILTVPRDPNANPEVLGQLIDPGDGTDPFGSNPSAQSMLQGGNGDAKENFEGYASGWSNGYIQTKAA